jgi:hypothetical protein
MNLLQNTNSVLVNIRIFISFRANYDCQAIICKNCSTHRMIFALWLAQTYPASLHDSRGFSSIMQSRTHQHLFAALVASLFFLPPASTQAGDSFQLARMLAPTAKERTKPVAATPQASENFESMTIGEETWRRLMVAIAPDKLETDKTRAAGRPIQLAAKTAPKKSGRKYSAKRKPNYKHIAKAEPLALAEVQPCHMHPAHVISAAPQPRIAPWQVRALRYGPKRA